MIGGLHRSIEIDRGNAFFNRFCARSLVVGVTVCVLILTLILIDDDNDGGGLSNDDDDEHATTNDDDAPGGTKKRYDDDDDDACDACDDGGVERKDDERLGHWLGWTRTRAVLETGGERVDGDAVLRARERRDRARTAGGDGKIG